MNPVNIRKCQHGDEGALSLIGRATFLESFAGILFGQDILGHCEQQHAVNKYAGWLEGSSSAIWLAEVDPGQAPVGYLVLTTPDLPLTDIAPADAEVKRIYLLPRFQGAGLGKRLMEEARSYAKARGVRRLLLGVYSQNTAAIRFYEKLGYRPVGTRSFKVGNTHYDDLILGLTLTAAK